MLDQREQGEGLRVDGIAAMTTTMPIWMVGTRLAIEMKNTLARAVKALNACAWRTASASLPNTRSGAIDTATNKRPISAALAPELARKKVSNWGGTIACKFEPSALVVLVGE